MYVFCKIKGYTLGFISSETISLIREKADIISVVGEYVHLISSRNTYKGLCPFHKEKTPSFTVSPEKQIYHCFGCGKGGDVFSFLMNIEHLTFPEAVRFLAAKHGIEIPKDYDPEADKRSELYRVLDQASKLFEEALNTPEGQIARDYLEQRHISEETVKKFRIGFAPDSWDYLTSRIGKNQQILEAMAKVDLVKPRKENTGYYDTFRNRLMIPIFDIHGRVSGFGGRVFSKDQEPKYLNSSESDTFLKRNMLFNFREALPTIRRQNAAIIVEGYMDVISLWQSGITNAVASLGTALTTEQIDLLARNVKNDEKNDGKLYFCYDADGAGQEATMRAIARQKGSPVNARVVVWDKPEYKDPDEYIKGEGVESFKKLLEKAEDIYTFLVNKRTKGMKYPLEIPVKEKIIQEFKELVLEMSPIAKRDIVRMLSQRLDIEPNILEKEFESKSSQSREFTNKAKIVSPALNADVQRQEWVLKYLLEQPAELEMVKAMLTTEDFSDNRLRAIYEAICLHQDTAGYTLKPAEILAMLDDDDLVSRLSELITTLEDRPEVPFKECIQGLVRSRLEMKLKLLQNRIREAESSGDDTAILQASMEQLETKRQFDMLVNSH